jgi:hypothetical protein
MKDSRHREIRGWILRALHINHPEGLTERNIYLALHDIFPGLIETALPSEMNYLRDKSYIKSNKVASELCDEIWIHKITAAGIDLMERSVPADPGIELPRCR